MFFKRGTPVKRPDSMGEILAQVLIAANQLRETKDAHWRIVSTQASRNHTYFICESVREHYPYSVHITPSMAPGHRNARTLGSCTVNFYRGGNTIGEKMYPLNSLMTAMEDIVMYMDTGSVDLQPLPTDFGVLAPDRHTTF